MTNHIINKAYNESLRQMELSDPVHKDILNPMFAQLINNDAYLMAVKNGQAINVKYPPIPMVGAIGDGIADDTTAIQNIIDYVNLLGGGIVLIPINTFKLTAPLIEKNNVRIIGMSMMGSILKQTGTGAVIKFDTTYNSTLYGMEIANLRLEGNLADTATGDGIYCSTPYGISETVFKNLWITKCGRSGFYFYQPNNPWWAQYLSFENIFIGDVVSSSNGCQSYAFYAEGGFSTNTFRKVRVHNNKKGIYIGKGSTIIPPETISFDTCNIQRTDNGDTVVHGIYVHDIQGLKLDNCYIESVGINDTTKASSGLFVDGWNSRNIVVSGGLFSNFHKAINLSKGNGASIDGVTYNCSDASYSTPVFLTVTVDYGVYTINLGMNQQFAGSLAVTYLNDNNRSVGFTNSAGGVFNCKQLKCVGSYTVPFIMNGNYLWIDGAGKLRIKSSLPGSDTDGVVVGSQT